MRRTTQGDTPGADRSGGSEPLLPGTNVGSGADAREAMDVAGRVRAWVMRMLGTGPDQHGNGPLAELTVRVVASLPAEVVDDLVGDPTFALSVYDPDRGGPVSVMLGRLQVAVGRGARSVSLRADLPGRLPAFARWVIAHEFAHAYLRNVCRPVAQAEREADDLAEAWGFPRPAETDVRRPGTVVLTVAAPAPVTG